MLLGMKDYEWCGLGVAGITLLGGCGGYVAAVWSTRRERKKTT